MKIWLPVIATLLLVTSSAWSQNCVDSAKVVPPTISPETRKTYETKLDEARKQYEKTPTDADAIIWLGRRTAYLGEYKEAVRIFSEGVRQFPKDARMLRHRGHRYITIRCFDDAVADLERALQLTRNQPDQVEPDGLPNAKNIPTGTLYTNIDYHRGLAYYLKSDWNRAAGAFLRAFNHAGNPDMRVAAAHWLHMSSRRRGYNMVAERILKEELSRDLDIIENHDYYTLIKLYLDRVKAGDLLNQIGAESKTLSSASLGYGLGNWYFYNGEKTRAMEIFRKITAGDQWASFGFIAAEVELNRK